MKDDRDDDAVIALVRELYGTRNRDADHEPQEKTNEPTWPESDLKSLRRLVQKYGSRAVSDAAGEVVPRSAGRPSRGNLPFFERMHLVQWLEEAAAEHRTNGVRNFTAAAINDLFDLTADEADHKQSGRYERFEKTIRRSLIEGRKDIRQFLEATSAQHPRKSTRAMAQKALDCINMREK